ncbi:hypothetical protein DdX_01439 [Ditylenchus destructor]|uniref:Uncharacterized protein n=1 Tax=Ditylenchus destructor TaxID=166010 RepID=A0AAD4RB77_9BILA|nr:hypothetical protein DdX_01439 [Ditylenchus destructor]
MLRRAGDSVWKKIYFRYSKKAAPSHPNLHSYKTDCRAENYISSSPPVDLFRRQRVVDTVTSATNLMRRPQIIQALLLPSNCLYGICHCPMFASIPDPRPTMAAFCFEVASLLSKIYWLSKSF